MDSQAQVRKIDLVEMQHSKWQDATARNPQITQPFA